MPRVLCALAILLGFSSCNTLIGIGRDTKQVFQWSKRAVQGDGGAAPVEPMATEPALAPDAQLAPVDQIPVY